MRLWTCLTGLLSGKTLPQIRDQPPSVPTGWFLAGTSRGFEILVYTASRPGAGRELILSWALGPPAHGVSTKHSWQSGRSPRRVSIVPTRKYYVRLYGAGCAADSAPGERAREEAFVSLRRKMQAET